MRDLGARFPSTFVFWWASLQPRRQTIESTRRVILVLRAFYGNLYHLRARLGAGRTRRLDVLRVTVAALPAFNTFHHHEAGMTRARRIRDAIRGGTEP